MRTRRRNMEKRKKAEEECRQYEEENKKLASEIIELIQGKNWRDYAGKIQGLLDELEKNSGKEQRLQDCDNLQNIKAALNAAWEQDFEKLLDFDDGPEFEDCCFFDNECNSTRDDVFSRFSEEEGFDCA